MYAPNHTNLTMLQNSDSFTNASSAPAQNILAISEAYPQLYQSFPTLDHESLDLVLEGADLAHEVGGLVGGDAAANNCAADTTGAAKSHLAGDVNLRIKVSKSSL